jgi:hypothetical protein
MAIGDQTDIFNRLKGLLPPWYGDSSPNLDANLKGGAGTALSFTYSFYKYAVLQTRIKTATGDFLDLISNDFFGTKLPRRTDENDASFRNRILARLLQEKATLNGMRQALYKLTGRYPIIYEPRWGGGFYGANSFYRQAVYGSRFYPYQFWIIAFRPTTNSKNPDYYNGASYYGELSYYGDISNNVITVTDQDIYDLIDDVKPIGTLQHVTISD